MNYLLTKSPKLKIRARIAVNLRYRNTFLIFNTTILYSSPVLLPNWFIYEKRHNEEYLHFKTVACIVYMNTLKVSSFSVYFNSKLVGKRKLNSHT